MLPHTTAGHSRARSTKTTPRAPCGLIRLTVQSATSAISPGVGSSPRSTSAANPARSQMKANAARSKVRSAVFAVPKHPSGLFVRTIGRARYREDRSCQSHLQYAPPRLIEQRNATQLPTAAVTIRRRQPELSRHINPLPLPTRFLRGVRVSRFQSWRKITRLWHVLTIRASSAPTIEGHTRFVASPLALLAGSSKSSLR